MTDKEKLIQGLKDSHETIQDLLSGGMGIVRGDYHPESMMADWVASLDAITLLLAEFGETDLLDRLIGIHDRAAKRAEDNSNAYLEEAWQHRTKADELRKKK